MCPLLVKEKGQVPSHVYNLLLYVKNEKKNRIHSYMLLFSNIKSERILRKQIIDYLGWGRGGETV